MEITVKLFGTIQIDRFKEKTLEFPSGIKAHEVAAILEIPDSFPGSVLINGDPADSKKVLHEGDVLVFLAFVCGG